MCLFLYKVEMWMWNFFISTNLPTFYLLLFFPTTLVWQQKINWFLLRLRLEHYGFV